MSVDACIKTSFIFMFNVCKSLSFLVCVTALVNMKLVYVHVVEIPCFRRRLCLI